MTTAPAVSGPTGPLVGEPLLRVVDVIKDFPGLRALDHVSLEVASGEIVALVGHNGSGKSTLVKILAGVEQADGGLIELAGARSVGDRQGQQDRATELHVIHQDLGLVAELTTVENIGLTSNTGRSSLAPTRRIREREHAQALISRFGGPFDVEIPLAGLAPAQRSVVAIARALDGWTHERNVLILDEPTEALHAGEVGVLFDAVRRTVRAGAGVVFISHRLDEVLSLADRVVVLRDGRVVADVFTVDLDHQTLVTHVTGVEPQEGRKDAHVRTAGDVVLDVEGLEGPQLHGISLVVREGEVLGVAGVLGSGRDTLLSVVFGAERGQADRFRVDGREYSTRSPRASVRRGFAFVAGDRAGLGSIGAMNARENMTLPELRSVTGRLGQLRRRRERDLACDLVDRYDVRPRRTEQKFDQFSGGNQQKIVFAKWLRNDPRILLLEEPTQGVDVGAKEAIYDEIDAAADRGVAVLVCSSDAKELVRLCDRVLVLRAGAVVAEIKGTQLDETSLVTWGQGFTDATSPPDQEGSS